MLMMDYYIFGSLTLIQKDAISQLSSSYISTIMIWLGGRLDTLWELK